MKKESIKGSAWNFLNMIVNQLRTFIVSLVLARLLTPSDFGLVSMAMVFNSILDMLVDFGFSSAIIRKKEISEVETSTVFWLNILIGLGCTVLVYGTAPLISWFYEMPQLNSIIHVTSWSFLISAFGTMQTALFQRNLNFRLPFIVRLVSGIISGALGIVLAILGMGVWALVFSNLSGWIVNSILIWFVSTWKPKFIFKPKSITDLISFGWKMTLSTIINRVFRQLDTFIIGKIYSAASLGLFNRAQTLNQLVIDYSFSSIRSVMLPSLSKLQNDDEALRYSVLKLLHVVSFLTFLFAGLMYVCAKDLILLLYGEQWTGAIEIFQILGLFSITLCIPVVFDTVMTVANRMNQYLWISVLRNSLQLFAIPVGLYYGLSSYIWAISIIGMIKLIPYLFSTYDSIKLPIRTQLSSIFRYALSFIIVLLTFNIVEVDTGYYVSNIIFSGVCYAGLYVLINFVMRNDGMRVCVSLILNVIHKK